MNENFTKGVIGILILALILAVSVGQVTANVAYTNIARILGAGLLLAAVSLGAERGTEILKTVARLIFGFIPATRSWQPKGGGSSFLAFVVAFAGVKKFDPAILSQFSQFNGIDPSLVAYITMALIWIGSAIWHNILPDNVGMAPKVKG